jgi:biotin-dependent carboxylase-like uncharacterized protein
MDSFSARLANLLAGNPENSACLEMTLKGPTLKTINPCNIAITGANLKPTVNGAFIDTWTTRHVKKDDVISFSTAQGGCRGYFAISGGIEVPQVLGSRSTYIRGGFGGYLGRPLRKGDIIRGTLSERTGWVRYVPPEYIPSYTLDATIRVILGPQDDFFTENAVKTFLNSDYEITPESDRMGYRLDGPTIEHSKEPEIVSDGVTAGSIQVPADGMPIVLMRDAQTVGGYPKIAHAISPDLNQLAQLTPGDSIKFKRVEIHEAHELLSEHVKRLEHLKEEIREKKFTRVS